MHCMDCMVLVPVWSRLSVEFPHLPWGFTWGLCKGRERTLFLSGTRRQPYSRKEITVAERSPDDGVNLDGLFVNELFTEADARAPKPLLTRAPDR